MLTRILVLTGLMLLTLFGGSAIAAGARASEVVDRGALDQFLDSLHSAPDAAAANIIAGRIWDIWLSPSDPALAKLMRMATLAIAAGDTADAIVTLDQVVQSYPDYAEGWNQRATLNFMLGRLDASLADIDRVLALEPRHFGALSGRVLIDLRQGKRAQALNDVKAALAVHPFLGAKQLFPELDHLINI